MEIQRRAKRDQNVHMRLTKEEKELLTKTMTMANATMTDVVVTGVREVHRQLAQEQAQEQ